MSAFAPIISADDAADELRAILGRQATPTVYVIQRRVSGSGMSRKLSLVVVDGEAADGLRDVTVWAAAVFGEKVYEAEGRHALNVRGAGMDMHWHTVYSLSRRLYEGRPEAGERDAGYYLNQRTL